MPHQATRPDGVWSESLASHRRRQTIHIGRTALELISQHGIAAVSMRQLADAAGVSRATLYNYFPDLESALLAYLQRTMEDYLTEVERALHGIDDPVERLDRYIEHQVAYLAADQHRTGAALFQAAAESPRLAPALSQHVGGPAEVVAKILADGKAAGALDPELDPELCTTLVLHLLAGACAALDSGMGADEAGAAVQHLLHHGLLRPRRGRRRPSRD